MIDIHGVSVLILNASTCSMLLARCQTTAGWGVPIYVYILWNMEHTQVHGKAGSNFLGHNDVGQASLGLCLGPDSHRNDEIGQSRFLSYQWRNWSCRNHLQARTA
ncbi:hypothetical protein ABBQ38_004091 [Trebouxia sp. C0009 RCD-2024]